MQCWQVLLFFSIIFAVYTPTNACKGCVSLDEYNFDKITSKFKVVLIKFDVPYPYGEKHDAFGKVADEIAQNKDILVGEVHIKDYGEQENEAIGKRFGIAAKEDLPAVRLIVKGKKDAIEFSKDAEWTEDNLKNLVRDNTDIYIGLPGCFEDYDRLAMKFVKATNKEGHVEQVEKLAEKGDEKEKSAAKIYIQYMKKIIEQGLKFVKQEVSRLGKIIKEGKVNSKKKEELSHRLNILHSFSIESKDEL